MLTRNIGLVLCLLALALGYNCLTTTTEQEFEHPRLASARDYVEATAELDTKFWHDKAQTILADKLAAERKTPKEKTAKNIILFLGDGMSVHTVTATRAYMGDSNKQVSFEKFPFVGLAKTYAVDERTPDSANTATAYLSGVKANYGTIGVNAAVKRKDCHAAADVSTHTESLAKWAQDANKWAGLVTTARVTHASPAGVYAHTADRNWENDVDLEEAGCGNVAGVVDIARQLVETPVGKDLHVVLGGGRSNFRDKNIHDEEGVPGARNDGRDLIDDWLVDKTARNAHYVWSRKGLASVDLSKTEYLLGLFSESHCAYHGDRQRHALEDAEPSLTEMTEAAIKVLSNSEHGYFLFVESGKIDMAHHEAHARKSLEETAEFARAVELARSMTDEEETLIVVTSDHSHTMTINGYPYRRQNILSLAPNAATDELPFTILSYANGPGYAQTYSSDVGRIDLNNVDTTDPEFTYMSTVPLSSETHGGEDVAVFASGPYEHYFAGNYEQSTVPALMAFAANIGPFTKSELGIE